jgi:hypothetical protein
VSFSALSACSYQHCTHNSYGERSPKDEDKHLFRLPLVLTLTRADRFVRGYEWLYRAPLLDKAGAYDAARAIVPYRAAMMPISTETVSVCVNGCSSCACQPVLRVMSYSIFHISSSAITDHNDHVYCREWTTLLACEGIQAGERLCLFYERLGMRHMLCSDSRHFFKASLTRGSLDDCA